MKQVLVTGATGYIGSRLTHVLLEHGHHVHLLLRKDSSLACLEGVREQLILHSYDGSYESAAAIFQANTIDTVFHLATWFNSTHKPENITDIIHSNILLGTHLLEAMAQKGCRRFINTGTYWQHNQAGEYSPNSLYAASKQAFSDIVDYYVHHVSAITIKLFDVYGKGDTRGKIFNMLDDASKNNKRLDMTAGEQQLRLTHVDDAVAAFLLAEALLGTPEHQKKHTLYFAGANPVALKEVVKTYMAVTGKKVDITWGALPYRQGQIMKPYTGIKLPGWSAQTSLEEGIRKSFI